MKHEYQRVYCVANSDGIPFHEQPNEGYTLQEAIDRVNREVAESQRLGLGGTDKDYIIYDMSTKPYWTRVL